jgi:hypothetical protein
LSAPRSILAAYRGGKLYIIRHDAPCSIFASALNSTCKSLAIIEAALREMGAIIDRVRCVSPIAVDIKLGHH